nr:uncharacterized protein LOC129383939 [Dermacentor andersoni]
MATGAHATLTTTRPIIRHDQPKASVNEGPRSRNASPQPNDVFRGSRSPASAGTPEATAGSSSSPSPKVSAPAVKYVEYDEAAESLFVKDKRKHRDGTHEYNRMHQKLSRKYQPVMFAVGGAAVCFIGMFLLFYIFFPETKAQKLVRNATELPDKRRLHSPSLTAPGGRTFGANS